MDSSGKIHHIDDDAMAKLFAVRNDGDIERKETGEIYTLLPAVGTIVRFAGRDCRVHEYRKNKIILKALPNAREREAV